ncbi:VOC family protein [Marinomonas balearica]|uniref:Catechol 2,3-dioxygenase-like lactoylglutathione lyase family enzyme n=1 Tax=Marinomonas balearica TaxID=491947 RepID=A0A4R6M2V2_9GAMM|nr:VOC family protein [Marinomonas balearica]TDO95587.1 catechol 2,3-dioxygenase-like lactoylglutathione lyase family enzyme [Marinomonas balearica]
MRQSIIHIALVVKDYDEAIDFYVNKLNVDLIEDTFQPEQNKRWVVVSPPGANGVTLLLARASNPEQGEFIGNQAGGRVFLFLSTDDFWRDYHRMVADGINFMREPSEADYGTVAVFEDLYGNLWDLLQLNPDHPMAMRT